MKYDKVRKVIITRTDIKSTIEYLQPGIGNHWFSQACDIEIEKNYRLFSYLANVRNHFKIVPIAKAKGYPKDASDEAIELERRWEKDRPYRHSVLTFEELKNKLPDEFREWKFFLMMELIARKYGSEYTRLTFFFVDETLS